VGHLRRHGYQVTTKDVDDLDPLRHRLGVPPALASCHIALVADYVVEGHVPARVIDRLLNDRPAVAGVAVPGMPAGSPGMEIPGRPPERYQVLAFDRSGRTTVFDLP
jgi:hypothetical protein